MKTSAVCLPLILGLLGCNFHPKTDHPLRGLPIAKHAIPAGAVIQEQDIEILELPSDELDAPELPRTISQVVGHKALEDIPKTGGILLTRISR
jgi:flagella basal body P-ring formation protein FlgA